MDLYWRILEQRDVAVGAGSQLQSCNDYSSGGSPARSCCRRRRRALRSCKAERIQGAHTSTQLCRNSVFVHGQFTDDYLLCGAQCTLMLHCSRACSVQYISGMLVGTYRQACFSSRTLTLFVENRLFRDWLECTVLKQWCAAAQLAAFLTHRWAMVPQI